MIKENKNKKIIKEIEMLSKDQWETVIEIDKKYNKEMMAREKKRFYKPDPIHSPYKEKCEICGQANPLDYCHILPLRFLRDIRNVNKRMMIDFDGKNILTLCRNHHFMFDRFQLTEEEFNKVKEKIIPILYIAFEISKNLSHGGKNHRDGRERGEHIINWLMKFKKYDERQRKTRESDRE